jgi:hypothetical protein
MSDEWLRPLKAREYAVDHHFDTWQAAERWLWNAVVEGRVRAKLKGIVLGPEWRKQLSKTIFDKENPVVLPPDLEISTDDIKRELGSETKEKEMTKIEIQITVRGQYEVENGLVKVTSGKAEKATQIGGSPPEVLAKMMLREIVADIAGEKIDI